jgi:hypothetical protein
MIFGWNPSPKLDVASLWLEGSDLEIAQVIAEETEAEREIEFAALPPMSEKEAATVLPPPPYLLWPPPPKTAGETRREAIDSIPWDALLRRGGAHSRCVDRTGLGHAALIEFAIDKCKPSNWEALFWYRQWVREAISDKVPRQTVALMMQDVKNEAAKLTDAIAAEARKDVAVRAAAAKVERDPKTEKKRFVREIWDRWQREPALYPSQAAFARDMLDKYGGDDPRRDLQSTAAIEAWCRDWKSVG